MRLTCFQVGVPEKSVVSSQPSFILSDFHSNSFTCRDLILLKLHNHIFYYLWEPIASSWATSHSFKVWLWLELKLNEVWVFTFYLISLVEERGVTWAHCSELNKPDRLCLKLSRIQLSYFNCLPARALAHTELLRVVGSSCKLLDECQNLHIIWPTRPVCSLSHSHNSSEYRS